MDTADRASGQDLEVEADPDAAVEQLLLDDLWFSKTATCVTENRDIIRTDQPRLLVVTRTSAAGEQGAA